MPWPLETSRSEDRFLRLQQALALRYRLERELGRVGPVCAYQARALDGDLPVALKIIEPAATAKAGAARLLRDIRTAARIEHRHLLPVQETGVVATGAGDAVYYAHPFLAGETLRSRLDREPRLPVAEALAIAEDVAGALAAVHERGLAHGRVTAESIVLAGAQAQLGDVGIAAALSEAEPDPRDDVAALGAILYEMLAGAPVPGGDGGPPPLRAGRAGIAEEVELTVAQMLAPPAERYRTAEETRLALQNAAAAARAVSIPGTSTGERLAAARRIPARWTVFILAVVGLLGLSLWLRTRAPAHAPTARGSVRPRSVAVLPFLNATPDTGNRALSEGLSREVTAGLGRIAGLRTADAGSAFWLGSPRLDPREAGRRLGVDAVLYGTVRPAEGRLRVRAQLLSVREGFDLWSETYERAIGQETALEQELVRTVAGVLRFPAPPPGGHTAASPEVRAQYLRGLHDAARGAAALAIGRFEETLRLDSTFAPAWAALAAEWLRAGGRSGAPPSDAAGRARAAADRALALDSSSAEARLVLGTVRFLHDWDWSGAEAEFRRSLALNPSLAGTHLALGHLLLATGRVDESLDEGRRALELSPLDPRVRLELARRALQVGDHVRAEAETERAAVLRRDAPGVDLMRGVIAAATGRYEAALAPLERAAADTVGADVAAVDEAVAMLGWVHALAGRREPARDAQATLQRTSAVRYVSAYQLAYLAEALGDRRAAFAALERALAARAPELVDLRSDARLDRLRADRRFDALARRIGLP